MLTKTDEKTSKSADWWAGYDLAARMTDSRIEALRLAHDSSDSPDSVINRAHSYALFLQGKD